MNESAAAYIDQNREALAQQAQVSLKLDLTAPYWIAVGATGVLAAYFSLDALITDNLNLSEVVFHCEYGDGWQ